MRSRFAWTVALMAIIPAPAVAQRLSGTLGDVMIPISDDRGRNVSVEQRPHPEYQAIGINLGAFNAYPKIATSVGYTDNAYQLPTKQSDGYTTIDPTLSIRSHWSANYLAVEGGGRFVRYFNSTPRDEDGYYFGAQGRYDASPDISFSLGARTARQYESRFDGSALNNTRSVSPYQATTVRGLIDSKFALTRLALAGDVTEFNFKSVQSLSGTTLNQDSRDRKIYRGALHIERELTPDASIFVEGSYVSTGYSRPLLPLMANRDSNEYKGLVGASFDLTNLLRGDVAVGYSKRNYDAPTYRDIGGVSVQGRIEYFLSELTTVTLVGRREIEDSSSFGSGGYFNNGIGLAADHELLRNVILHAGADYERDAFRGVNAKVNIWSANGGVKYLLNNTFGLTGRLTYADRSTTGTSAVGFDATEFRAMFGFTVQR